MIEIDKISRIGLRGLGLNKQTKLVAYRITGQKSSSSCDTTSGIYNWTAIACAA